VEMKIDKEKLINAIKEKYDVDYVTPYEHVKSKVAREIIKLIEEFEEEVENE